MKKIILASQSPRRRELMQLLDYEYEVCPSTGDEEIAVCAPEQYVMSLSERKALDVAGKKTGDGLVLGADTIVVYEGEILGKPRDSEEAFRMLKNLAGHLHSVFTGVTLVDLASGRKKSFYEKTEVEMYAVSDDEIKAYIKTGDPFDKAGGYGVQSRGAFLVKSIRGDFYNVVGLPVARLNRELLSFFHTMQE